jgi:Adenylate and Guanylate cyclase catalytic domain
MFADISGFTSWSSTREPTQVFQVRCGKRFRFFQTAERCPHTFHLLFPSLFKSAQLLETIYKEFDRIAKRRRVFKVETVGDCYGTSLSTILLCIEQQTPNFKIQHAKLISFFLLSIHSTLFLLYLQLPLLAFLTRDLNTPLSVPNLQKTV